MKTLLRITLAIIAICIFGTGYAIATDDVLTVVCSKDEYAQEEDIHFTITNGHDQSVYSGGTPPFYIISEPPGTFFYPETALPELFYFDAGEAVDFEYTDRLEPGLYHVGIMYFLDDNKTEITEFDIFTVTSSVAVERTTWSNIKAIY